MAVISDLRFNHSPSGGNLAEVVRNAISASANTAGDFGRTAHVLLLSLGSGNGLWGVAREALELFARAGSGSVASGRAIAALPRVAVAQTAKSTYAGAVLSAAEQTRELLAALAINKSELAEALRVSRPTLYEWLDGKEPATANQLRLTCLLRLISRAGVSSKTPLNNRLVRHPLRDGELSLLEVLGEDQLDEAVAENLLREIWSTGQEMKNRRLRREEHLEALGFESATPEQRRERLARNTAGRLRSER